MKEIERNGGKILSSMPIDRTEVENVYLATHPKEFRKPNYLIALAVGKASFISILLVCLILLDF